MSTTAETDHDEAGHLLVATAAGDREAFETLYRRTSPKLFGICLRLIPQRSEAEDVLQEIYVLVWNKASQFDPARARGTVWLAQVARHRAIDHLRARPGLRRLSLDEAPPLPSPQASPAEVTETRGTRQRIAHCIDQLEPSRGQLIRTAFFEGCTYEELAERSQTPLGTVKSWIRRSLAKLKVCLER